MLSLISCLLALAAATGTRTTTAPDQHEPCTIAQDVSEQIRTAAVCLRRLNFGFGGYGFTHNLSPKSLGSGLCDTHLSIPACCIDECQWRKRCTTGQFVADIEPGERNPRLLCCVTESHTISATQCKWIKVTRTRKSVNKYIYVTRELKAYHGFNETAFFTKLILEDDRPSKLVARFQLCNATLNVTAPCVAGYQAQRLVSDIVGVAVGVPVGVAVPVGIAIGLGVRPSAVATTQVAATAATAATAAPCAADGAACMVGGDCCSGNCDMYMGSVCAPALP